MNEHDAKVPKIADVKPFSIENEKAVWAKLRELCNESLKKYP